MSNRAKYCMKHILKLLIVLSAGFICTFSIGGCGEKADFQQELDKINTEFWTEIEMEDIPQVEEITSTKEFKTRAMHVALCQIVIYEVNDEYGTNLSFDNAVSNEEWSLVDYRSWVDSIAEEEIENLTKLEKFEANPKIGMP